MKRKKQKKVNNKYKKESIIAILVFCILLFMASGYALLNTKLTINGKGKLDIPEYSIYISSIKLSSTTNDAYQSASPTYTDNEVAMYTALPNLNSTATYEVIIKNVGTSDAIVDYIYASSDNENIKYRVNGVSATDTVKGLSNVTVKIDVMYNENATSTISSSSLMFNFQFLKKTSSYSNSCTLSWDGSTSSEPTTTDIYGKTYYQITNANELNWFKGQVDGGNTGVNAILNNNICINSNSFTVTSAYTGIFDGQNRTIEGLSFSRDTDLEDDTTYEVGLFKTNSGTIKNLNVDSSIVDNDIARTSTGTNYLGGIVVHNTGIVENTSFSGSITVNEQAIVNCLIKQAHNYTYIGGISAENTGIIRSSVNKASFDLTSYASYSVCNLYTRSANITSGGIVGINKGYISDSYNSATHTSKASTKSDNKSTATNLVGGVLGTNEKEVSDIYNSGSIVQTLSGVADSSTYGVIASNSGNISNTYYLSGTAINNIGSEVSSNDLTNLNITLSAAFIKSSTYPKLFWE